MEFNIRFTGDYQLLKWIINKYKGRLPYNGIMDFMNQNLYSAKNTAWFWEKGGVPQRVWNSIHKDLIMARLTGRIKDEEIRTLTELKNEFLDSCE